MKSNIERLKELLAMKKRLDEALSNSKTIECRFKELENTEKWWWDRYKQTLFAVLRDVAHGKAYLPREAALGLANALEESILTGKTPELFKSLPSKTSEPYELLHWKKIALRYMIFAACDGNEALKKAKREVVEGYGVDIRTVNNWLNKIDTSQLFMSTDDNDRDWINLMFSKGIEEYKRLAPPRRGSKQ